MSRVLRVMAVAIGVFGALSYHGAPVSAADLAVKSVVEVEDFTEAQVDDKVAITVARTTSNGSIEISNYVAPTPAAAELYTDKVDNLPGVVAASIDTQSEALSSDQLFPNQWDMARLNSDGVQLESNGSGMTVAVIDTGVAANHPDLAGQVLPGKDYIDAAQDGRSDPRGHGTHVAGTIAALTGNGIGVGSIAPGAKILPVRVLDADGKGYVSNIAAGIIWAADNGADVINLSLGGPTQTTIEEAAVNYATSKGVIVVAAAGNSGNTGNPVMYPAAYSNAIAVSATDRNDNTTPWSEFGPQVDISAPGESILSTYPAGYTYMSGTSMATPHVAAAAAAVKASNPSLTGAQVRSALESTADDMGAPGRDDQFGMGFLDIAGALSAVGTQPPVLIPEGTPKGAWMTAGDGGVFSMGGANFYGSTGAMRLNQPIVGMATTGSGSGYRFVASDGGVFSFGDANFYGSTGAMRLNQPVVGMSTTPSGNGYWLVASDGGIFSFGDAAFYGSTGAMRLNKPIVGMSTTPSGHGYWLVASDGGIFCFGDAEFYGSAGAMSLDSAVAGMSTTKDGRGYYITTASGRVYTFGNAVYKGGIATRGIVSIATSPIGNGYVLAGADGSLTSFGDARALVPTSGRLRLNKPVVGVSLAAR